MSIELVIVISILAINIGINTYQSINEYKATLKNKKLEEIKKEIELMRKEINDKIIEIDRKLEENINKKKELKFNIIEH